MLMLAICPWKASWRRDHAMKQVAETSSGCDDGLQAGSKEAGSIVEGLRPEKDGSVAGCEAVMDETKPGMCTGFCLRHSQLTSMRSGEDAPSVQLRMIPVAVGVLRLVLECRNGYFGRTFLLACSFHASIFGSAVLDRVDSGRSNSSIGMLNTK